jgi:hypothetical protein
MSEKSGRRYKACYAENPGQVHNIFILNRKVYNYAELPCDMLCNFLNLNCYVL